MIPAEFAAHAERTFGTPGRDWVASLPSLVADLERRWSIRTGGALGTGVTSVVLAAETVPGEEPLALKLGWYEDENRYEPDALRVYDGDGAARLLEADAERGALLLERLDPEWSLLGLDETDAIPIACTILRRLWRPAGDPFPRLADAAGRWIESIPRRHREWQWPIERRYVEEAVELLEWLIPTSPEPLLLHQDAHHGNFLAAEREPWLIIDPKPILGDPADDLYAQLRGRFGVPDTVERVRRRLDLLAAATGLDRDRIRGWAIAHNLAWFGPAPSWDLDQARLLSAV